LINQFKVQTSQELGDQLDKTKASGATV